jgi:hypothetical protein
MHCPTLQSIAHRYFPFIVFLGCVMFSVLHALTYRLEQRAMHEAHAPLVAPDAVGQPPGSAE